MLRSRLFLSALGALVLIVACGDGESVDVGSTDGGTTTGNGGGPEEAGASTLDAAVRADAAASDVGAEAASPDAGITDAESSDGAIDGGPDAADAAPACVDVDGDGFGVGPGCAKVDCEDHDPLVNPDMQEIADDGFDNDCSGGDLKAATGPGSYVDGSSAACSDSAPDRGTKAKPYCSIEKAVLDSYQVLPVTSEGHAFFVAKGTYPLVLGMPKSIRLYGGYDAADWTWDPAGNETIIGGQDPLESSDGRACRLGAGCSAKCVCVGYESWVSINTDANAVLSGFTIQGGLRAGAPIFGIIVNSSGHVTLAHDRVTAGTGIQAVTIQIPPSAKNVWLLHDRITGGSPQSSTVFAVNNLGTATLFGNTIAMGPGAAGSYGAAVQNYGEMRLAANVLNPGDQGENTTSSYGLINTVADNPPAPPTKGTAFAVGNVIFGGRGKESSRGVLSNSPLTLVDNVIGDRTSTPLPWTARPTGSAIPLDVGFASKTYLHNNVLWNLPYSDEPAPPNAGANRHLFVHSSASSVFVDAIATVNECAWTGCQSTGDNLALTPVFVNPAGDFHVAPGSALAGKGTSTSSFITGGLGHRDIDGDLRPLGGAWDIGVDEVP